MKRADKKHIRESQRALQETTAIITEYRQAYLSGEITDVDVVSIKDSNLSPLYIFTVTRKTGKSIYPIRSLEVAKKLLINLDIIFYVDINNQFIVQDSRIGEANYGPENY